jgi:tetraacyldisaccharide 4'-kinase
MAGQKIGFLPAVIRGLLKALSLVYRLVIAVRNSLYNIKVLRTHKVPVPVISVGNITAGGTGKTPMVIWLCQYLAQKPLAVLTRGYKTKTGAVSSDEPAMISQSCPHAKTIVNPNRSLAADKAVKNYNAKVLIMDDGFQHRKLARDLDILTIDATNPFGFEKMLPAGLLREPLSQLKRAHAAVITRCDQASTQQIDTIENKLRQINPKILVARSIHQPVQIRGIRDFTIQLDDLKDTPVCAFCGIGNPQSFFQTLENIGANLVAKIPFNDHHTYSQSDLHSIYAQARENNAQIIIATQKDWTKTVLLAQNNSEIPMAYLEIKLKFIAAQQEITALIDQTIQGTIDASD